MKVALSGDRASGKLHLGHYVGALQSRLDLQNRGENLLVMVADIQALTDNCNSMNGISENVYEIVKDYLAVGIDPETTTIFLQSQIPEIAELTIYFLNLVTMNRLTQNPTIKTEISQKNYGDQIPLGFLCYPVSQAADIAIFDAELIPVGEDQLPIIEQTNRIMRKFNTIFNIDYFRECVPYLSKYPRLVGIDGKTKASKSMNNAIFLSDSPSQIEQKVFSMYTDPEHIHVNDPGKIEGNVVFAYLDIFHEDKDELQRMKEHYVRGGLGDMVIKRTLNDDLQKYLFHIREKRETIEYSYVDTIINEGSKKAKEIASKRMKEIKKIIYG